MLNSSLVSIIIPVYNSEKFILSALNSVISQTFSDWEVIIIDDYSTDNSLKLILDIAKSEKRIQIIRNNRNYGAGITRNKGIQSAKSRYIAFLDSDDIWHPDKLKIQIGLMEKFQWAFTHTSYGYISSDGKKMDKIFKVSKKPVSYNQLLKRTEVFTSTVIYNQDLIGKHFMSDHRRKQDYALWLSILKTGTNSRPIHEVLSFYRLRKNLFINRNVNSFIDHISFLKETQNFNYFKSLYYSFYWFFNGFFRYFIK